MHLEIDRSDIRTRRMTPTVVPTHAGEGEVVLEIEEFALTSNNISYAFGGDALDYWGFFPTEAGWGRLPAMGFARVVASGVNEIPVGSRYFGFYPVADHHVVQARVSRTGFVDASPHREPHAMAYRAFDRADPSRSRDDEAYYLLLRGLFVTSYLCDDFLADNAMFGAEQMIITSASSKTSLALAHETGRNAHARTIGLTSTSNISFTSSTSLYDSVVSYDDIEALDPSVPTVIVDMAGNSTVLQRLHQHFGDALAYSCRVGATHWENTIPAGRLPGPKPQFFFAPSQLAKRGQEWGRAELEDKMNTALNAFMTDARRWLTLSRQSGPDAALAVYDQLVSGQVDPAAGHVVSLASH